MPGHYPYLLNTSAHPDRSRCPLRVPTWETFEGQPQFTTLRVFDREGLETHDLSDGQLFEQAITFGGENGEGFITALARFTEKLGLYTQRYGLGRIIWPTITTIFAENFPELVYDLKERGLWLFDIWGYTPGNSKHTCWAQYTVKKEVFDLLYQELGDRFLGFDNGEQDGRYVGIYAGQQCPAPTERYAAYLHFQRHFAQLCRDLGNHMVGLVSLCFGHYFLKEGNHILLGAETAQALPNSQVYYAFIRGAGKQYGVHWFGNASCFNRWGYKDYDCDDTEEGYCPPGPRRGSSLNLLKRLIYTHYFYNCVALGFELGYLTKRQEYAVPGFDNWNHPEEGPYLSPIGAIQTAMARFVGQAGHPGVMHAPVALLLDHFAGWTMPRHLYSKQPYQVWGAMPYDAGDFLTHDLLSLCYPCYEDSSYYKNEQGFLSDTPFGDMMDCVLSDLPSWVLGQYTTVVAAGRLKVDDELRDKIEVFVRDGRHFVVTAANARVLWHELEIGDPYLCAEGTEIMLTDGRQITEPYCFTLCSAKVPQDAQIIARAAEKPVAFTWTNGQGQITVLLSPYGLNAQQLCDDTITSECNAPLSQPFVLLEHVKVLVGDALATERLFSVGDNLGYITARRAEGTYWLLLHNNGLTAQPFQITSHCGSIQSISEVTIDTSEKACAGYWPMGFEGNDGGISDDAVIAGGDVRLFEIQVAEQDIRILPEAVPPKPPHNRYLTINLAGTGVQEAIEQYPTFFQHFSGVKIDWTWFRDRDPKRLSMDRIWREQQGLSVLVDFSSGCNHYPDLSFLSLNRERYEESLTALTDVFDKMVLLGANGAVLSLHGLAEEEGYQSLDINEPYYRENLAEICRIAAERDITLYLQQHQNKRHAQVADMRHFIADVDVPNLKFALSTGHAIMAGISLADAMATAGEELDMLLLNAPERDFIGRWYDAHRPIAGANLDLSLLTTSKALIVFDGQYRDWDAIYGDVKAWEQAQASVLKG